MPTETDAVTDNQFRFGWLFGYRTDLAFFFLPVFAGVAALVLVGQPQVSNSVFLSFMLAQGLGAGPFHLGATWSHLEDAQIKTAVIGTGKKALITWLAAAGIILFSVWSSLYIYPLVYVIWLMTTIQHLSRQNAGILRLYYNVGCDALPGRDAEGSTLHRAAWLWSIICVLRFEAANYCDWRSFAMTALTGIVALWFMVSVKNYLADLRTQANNGRCINASALMYWLVSITFLAPFAFLGKNYEQALMIPLVMHWFQYIGLNYMLVRRKQKASDALASGSLWRFFAICTAYAAIILSAGLVFQFCPSGVGTDIARGFVVGLTLLHYLQDAFVWRMSDPIIRSRVLPYLKPAAPAVLQATKS